MHLKCTISFALLEAQARLSLVDHSGFLDSPSQATSVIRSGP